MLGFGLGLGLGLRLGLKVSFFRLYFKIMSAQMEHLPSLFHEEKTTKALPRRNCKAKTPLNQLECDLAIGLHFTYFKILTALPNTMIDNFQFWQKQELNFTFQL